MSFELLKTLSSEVISQFSTGKVDLKAAYAELKSVGFNDPIKNTVNPKAFDLRWLC